MISTQAYRISIGTFNLKFSHFLAKNSTYYNGRGEYNKNRTKSRSFCLNPKLFLIFFLLGVNINNTYSRVIQVSNNRTNHILNGNITKKGNLIFFTWNKGNSSFKTKRDDILITLERYKPDVFAIHEANFHIFQDKGFENYSIECNTLTKGHNIARTILLIKKGLAYKRRSELENK